ncbi:hypothetical protein SAMN04487965_2963 [Microbulbifer donghaiensis]|uniref:Lipoprotein n=1 Tax=Microbulbifer donghaiensis TaxID=494016 RepID=A0A1M5FLE0_9GAMM|nr:hypothetical protein [Microbulbifer donghaiensis]SHF92340.1 hypothetical protein SAMN04487965_2963 [Microbulbifer donghaiensis]
MRILLITGFAILLSACAANQPNEQGRRPGGPEYPPVSLFYKYLSEELRLECNQFSSRSVLHHCVDNQFDLTSLKHALSRSGSFLQVALGQKEQDYQLLASIAVLDEETGGEIGNAALSGATLMMLPIVMEKTIRAEIVVTWKEVPIKRYDYTIPFEYSASIFNAGSYDDSIAAHIAEKLLSDLEQENVFAGAYLMAALQASDYENDLSVPETIEDYLFDEKYIHNNPFFGALLTFQHRQFAFDRAEVYIYPIRSTDWTDTATITQGEAENLRRDLKLMQREGQFKEVVLDSVEPLNWKVGGKEIFGSFYSNTLTDVEGQQVRTATYVFTKGDKFVRIRAIFPVQEGSATAESPDKFVHTLLEEVSLPEESLFMARLRQQRRQTEIGM